jgi:hypothetical protein
VVTNCRRKLFRGAGTGCVGVRGLGPRVGIATVPRRSWPKANKQA